MGTTMSAHETVLSSQQRVLPRPGWKPAGWARAAGDAVPPPALVLLSIVSVQVGAGLAKSLFAALPPSGVVSLRVATAAIILVAVGRPSLRGCSRRDLAVVAGFGLAMATMNFSIYQAFARIPLGIAVTIEFLGPLSVAVIGSRRKLDLVWVLLAGAGVALLARGGGDISVVGVAFALLAAAGWASYILLSAATGQRFQGQSGLVIAMVVTSVLVLPVGIGTSGAALLDPRLLALGIAVGLLSSLIPYSLELQALRRIPARVFGILLSLEPAVAALVGLAVLGEVLGLRSWLAIGCVVAASIGATRTQSTPES